MNTEIKLIVPEDETLTEYANVSELNNEIKDILEDNYSYNITVSGELSNFKISGRNLYATLKDNNASVSIAYWGYLNKNKSVYNNGDNVKITGRLSLYAKNGTYNINITSIEKTGSGNIHEFYNALKQKYNNMGYFTNKKQMPNNIQNIGIITASSGAALQDILYVLNKNKYHGNVYIKNCMVQGDKSASSICSGITFFDNFNCDIILIARGGGSFEDLMSYSSEEVINAIYSSNKFTISAVGHEVDFMLSDFVADLRAPTPSIGAEIICRAQNELLDNFNIIKSKINTECYYIIAAKLQKYKDRIKTLRYKLNENKQTDLHDNITKLNSLKAQLYNKMKASINKYKNIIQSLNNMLAKHDILTMMDNGYAIIIKGNTVINTLDNIKSGQKLKIKMRDSYINVIVS